MRRVRLLHLPRDLGHLLKVAIIIWRDAAQSKPGWVSGEELCTKLVKSPSIITSAGLYVGKVDGRHIISTGLSDDGDFLGWTAIPANMIKKIQFIELKGVKHA